MNHHPRKRFGQNFLVDNNICHKIVSSVGIQPNDNVIEIGPGRGALTALILAQCPNLQVIELDRDLIPRLAALDGASHMVVHQGDVLRFDLRACHRPSQRMRLIGNLPYNISTPLLFHVFDYIDDIQDCHFMLQKEVVDRLSARVGSKAYGRLTVMAQSYCQVQPLFDVSAQCFFPVPQVESTIVRLVPLQQRYDIHDRAQFSELVRQAFGQRRKTLRNNLKKCINPEALADQGIDVSLRPEQLGVVDYVRISNIMYNYRS